MTAGAAGCVVIGGQLACPLATSAFNWGVGVGVAPVLYTVKCGTVPGGPYPLTHTVSAPTVQEPLRAVLTTPGTYWCVTTASNAAGESLPSNEVTFTATVAAGSDTTGVPTRGAIR